MIRMTVTLDGKANIHNFTRNLKTNLRRSQTQIVSKITNHAFKLTRALSPEWSGDLRSKVAMKVMPRSGEVFIGGSWIDQAKAKANELGVRPHFVNRYNNPLIDQWANEKGYIYSNNPDLVMVGGAGTALGKKNKFFEPAFEQVLRDWPFLASDVIKEIVLNTRA